MTVQALLGDPAPPLSGPMVPHRRCEGLEAGRLGVPGQVSPLLSLRAAPWSPSSVSGQPRPLTGPASSSKVRVAWAGWWDCASGFHEVAVTLNDPLDSAPILSPSTRSPEGRPSPLLSEGPEFKAAAAQATAAPSVLLDGLHLRPTPPVGTAVAVTSLDAAPVLPPEVPHQEGSALEEETQSWARWAEWAWGEG